MLIFFSPYEFAVLDLTDKNWQEEFSKEEKDEINSLILSTITYPPIPDDMIGFLKAISSTVHLPAIFNHLESTPLNYQSRKHLLWLKYSVLNAIYLIGNHYLPISDQSEEDICTHVWKFVADAFNIGKLTAKKQKSSTACKDAIHKNRKVVMMETAEKQQHPMIPD